MFCLTLFCYYYWLFVGLEDAIYSAADKKKDCLGCVKCLTALLFQIESRGFVNAQINTVDCSEV